MKTSNRFLMSIAGLGGLLYGVDFGVIAAAALVDRKGRTWLLKVGTGGMTIGLAAIGSAFLAIERFGVQANNFTGLLTMLAFFFIFITALFIPETKGKTLEEIEHLWDRR